MSERDRDRLEGAAEATPADEGTGDAKGHAVHPDDQPTAEEEGHVLRSYDDEPDDDVAGHRFY